MKLGIFDGTYVGVAEGMQLGVTDGTRVGITEGMKLGRIEGTYVGTAEGMKLGWTDGAYVAGFKVGVAEAGFEVTITTGALVGAPLEHTLSFVSEMLLDT